VCYVFSKLECTFPVLLISCVENCQYEECQQLVGTSAYVNINILGCMSEVILGAIMGSPSTHM
jgi:hypothetical protein